MAMNTVKPLSIVSEGTANISDKCGKTIAVRKLLLWAMYRDESE
jgi:hypothetical protein